MKQIKVPFTKSLSNRNIDYFTTKDQGWCLYTRCAMFPWFIKFPFPMWEHHHSNAGGNFDPKNHLCCWHRGTWDPKILVPNNCSSIRIDVFRCWDIYCTYHTYNVIYVSHHICIILHSCIDIYNFIYVHHVWYPVILLIPGTLKFTGQFFGSPIQTKLTSLLRSVVSLEFLREVSSLVKSVSHMMSTWCGYN